MQKAMKKGLRDKVLARDNHQCVRHAEGTCRGRMNTMEHAFGRKYERLWNTLTMCAYHAGVDEYQGSDGFNKEINRLHAYLRATDDDLAEFTAIATPQEKLYLMNKYEHLVELSTE